MIHRIISFTKVNAIEVNGLSNDRGASYTCCYMAEDHEQCVKSTQRGAKSLDNPVISPKNPLTIFPKRHIYNSAAG